MNWLKKFGWLAIAAIVLAVVFSIGFYSGLKTSLESQTAKILNATPQINANKEEVDFAEFWHAWNIAEEKYVNIDKDKIRRSGNGNWNKKRNPYSGRSA